MVYRGQGAKTLIFSSVRVTCETVAAAASVGTNFHRFHQSHATIRDATYEEFENNSFKVSFI